MDLLTLITPTVILYSVTSNIEINFIINLLNSLMMLIHNGGLFLKTVVLNLFPLYPLKQKGRSKDLLVGYKIVSFVTVFVRMSKISNMDKEF